jgi:hypothetical protein
MEGEGHILTIQSVPHYGNKEGKHAYHSFRQHGHEHPGHAAYSMQDSDHVVLINQQGVFMGLYDMANNRMMRPAIFAITPMQGRGKKTSPPSQEVSATASGSRVLRRVDDQMAGILPVTTDQLMSSAPHSEGQDEFDWFSIHDTTLSQHPYGDPSDEEREKMEQSEEERQQMEIEEEKAEGGSGDAPAQGGDVSSQGDIHSEQHGFRGFGGGVGAFHGARGPAATIRPAPSRPSFAPRRSFTGGFRPAPRFAPVARPGFARPAFGGGSGRFFWRRHVPWINPLWLGAPWLLYWYPLGYNRYYYINDPYVLGLPALPLITVANPELINAELRLLRANPANALWIARGYQIVPDIPSSGIGGRFIWVSTNSGGVVGGGYGNYGAVGGYGNYALADY